MATASHAHDTHAPLAPTKHAAKEAGPYDALLLNPDRSDVGEEHLTVRDEQVLRSEEAFAEVVAKGAEHARAHNPDLHEDHHADHPAAKKK
jgi:hypothetical protein